MRTFWLGLLLATLLAVQPAIAADMTFKPVANSTPKGPSEAAGAVIWNHGANSYYGVNDVTSSPPATFVNLLRNQGWDLFRLDRPSTAEELKRSVATLRGHAEDLKRQGYRKVVLAGQSAGAWISVIVAGQSDAVYAVIGNAPAYRGVNWEQKQRNGSELFDNLETIKHGRIMLSFFDNDPYDPGGRGVKTAEILTKAAVPHLVIDLPEGFTGHGAGNGDLFARRFGDCILAMAADGPVPQKGACENAAWGKKPSKDLDIPDSLRVAAPGGKDPAIERYFGKWYGVYPNGREFLFAIEAVNGTEVSGVYISGSMLEGSRGSRSDRKGQFGSDGLIFKTPGQPTLSYKLREDGKLDARWDAADGKGWLAAVMETLP